MQTKMQIFIVSSMDFSLPFVVLSNSDSLSSSLQRAELCAVDAQKNAKLSVTVLRRIQSDRMQDSIGPRSLKCCEVGVQAPSLTHHRKMSSRYFEGNAQPEYHSNVEDFYCQFETVDTVANCIVEHFNQEDYTMHTNCEQVLLKGTLGELVSQYVDQLCEFYTDFDSDTLQSQLFILAES